MKRQELAHILRAACAVSQDEHVLVLGSQSILGSYDEDDLPEIVTISAEADIAFLDDCDRKKADLVEGAIGEMSGFHNLNHYFAEGIHLETVTLPAGWRDRMVSWEIQSSYPARPLFLDPHDLALSKLVAYRRKDLLFVGALLEVGLLDRATLIERARDLPDSVPAEIVDMVVSWVGSDFRGGSAGQGPTEAPRSSG